MTELPSDEAALRRASVLAAVNAVEAACGGLCLLLPVEQTWRGPASVAFRLRVAGLRDHVDRALDALAAARAML